MADSELTLVMKAKDFASKSVAGLRGSITSLHTAAGKATGGLAKMGGGILDIGRHAGLVAAGGIVALVGALGFATKAAADEQVGIVRMNAALKSNIPGWKGNTDAIEAMIAKREKLAFSDDDLRASMTILVTRFKDVAKASSLQTTAMDLARLKGIPLADASDLLSKALMGNQKVLKQLGIQLPKHASQTQILAAIQKAAAGQAEAYGKTSKSAMESFKIAAADLVEDIGSTFLPIMTGAFKFLTDTGIPAIRGIGKSIGDWFKANQPLIKQVGAFVGGALAKAGSFIGGTLIPAVVNLAARILAVLVPAVQGIIGAIANWIATNQPLIKGIGDFASGVMDAFITGIDTIRRIFTDFGPLPAIIAAVAAAVWVLTAAVSANPIAAVILAVILAVGLLKKAWDSNFGGIRDITAKVFGVVKTIFGGAVSFISTGINTVKLVLAGFSLFFSTVWSTITGVAKGAVNFLIGLLNGIIGAIDSIQVHIGKIGMDTPLGFVGVGPFDWPGLRIPKLKYLAEGGIVRKPMLAMIGEDGPEAVVPLSGRRGGAGALGGGHTFNFNSIWPPTPAQAREIAGVIDRELHLRALTAGSSLSRS